MEKRGDLRKPTRESSIYRYTDEREALLSQYASRSDQALRRKNRKPEDIRTPYSRDADRIIHTRAYTRYIDKTQVFISSKTIT
jgi:dGTPase